LYPFHLVSIVILTLFSDFFPSFFIFFLPFFPFLILSFPFSPYLHLPLQLTFFSLNLFYPLTKGFFKLNIFCSKKVEAGIDKFYVLKEL